MKLVCVTFLCALACCRASDEEELESFLSGPDNEKSLEDYAPVPYHRPYRTPGSAYGPEPSQAAYDESVSAEPVEDKRAHEKPTYKRSTYRRPASKRPAYKKPAQKKSYAQAPTYEAKPTYSTKQYDAPTYEASPTYEAPTYASSPTYEAPTYVDDSPPDDSPTYHDAPTYEETTDEAPYQEVSAYGGAPTYEAHQEAAPTYEEVPYGEEPTYEKSYGAANNAEYKCEEENEPGYAEPKYHDHENEDDKATDLCSAGMSQSPVDLTTQATVLMPTLTADPISFNDAYHRVPRKMALSRHGMSLDLETEDRFRKEISGAGLHGKYILHNIHVHFGYNGSNGYSEHLINGKGYPAEMHFVHYNSEFEDLKSAIASNRRDALAVFAVFFDLRAGGRKFSRMKENFKEIEDGAKIPVEPFPVTSLFPDLGDFHRYHGSLTTPPCNEVVAWTVFSKPVIRRPRDERRRLKFIDQLTLASFGRFAPPRPDQPLNGRAILRSVTGNGYND